MERANLWTTYSEEQLGELEKLNESYKEFLDCGKTERECIREAVRMAKEAGYQDLDEVLQSGRGLKSGDFVYRVCME